MKKARPTQKRQSRKLILGHLENISSKVFGEYPNEIARLVKERHGVYALYKKSKLYYVGLARKLGVRLKQHLKDKHAGKWERFSLYLIRDSEHIHELESLLLRIASPNGNTVKGGLKGAENMLPELKRTINVSHKSALNNLLNQKAPKGGAITRSTKPKTPKLSKTIPMELYAKKRFGIQREYKGKLYKATVRPDGKIRYLGKLYPSPSQAATVIRSRPTNGWQFWRYQNKAGDWVKLSQIRN